MFLAFLLSALFGIPVAMFFFMLPQMFWLVSRREQKA